MIAFVATGIVWLTQISKLLYLIDRGIGLSHFAGLIILVIPSLLFVILPFITVFAVIYTYNRLGEERQLIILKSSGLNNFRLAKPALIVAGLVTVLSYYLSLELMPFAYRKLKADLNFIKNNYASNMIREKTFNQLSKFITLYVDKKLADGSLEGLVLFDNRSGEAAILFAKSGKFGIYDNIPVFDLKEGSRQAYDNNHNLTKLYFSSLRVELSSDKQAKLEQDSYNRDINEYYIKELLNPSNKLLLTRQNQLMVEGHQRLIWPLYNLVLTFLALAVFLQQPYNKKSHARQIFLTVLAVIFVTYWHFTFQNIATKNINFILVCYSNLIISLIFSLWLYSRRTI